MQGITYPYNKSHFCVRTKEDENVHLILFVSIKGLE
jgi:hypothetical protein